MQDSPAGNIYIFNQYYIELLKACKNNAKSAKDIQGARGKMARDLLRAVKKHYSSFDKLSPEHIEFFKAQNGEVAGRFRTKRTKARPARSTRIIMRSNPFVMAVEFDL